MLLEIIDTTMPASDGASPSSIEVQADLEQLSVIPMMAKQCSPRPKATPIPELGSVSLGGPYQEYNLVKDRDRCTIKHIVRYGFEELAKLTAFAILTSVGDPSSFQETMNS